MLSLKVALDVVVAIKQEVLVVLEVAVVTLVLVQEGILTRIY